MRSVRLQGRIARGAQPARRLGARGFDVKPYADGDVLGLWVRTTCTDAREARRS